MALMFLLGEGVAWPGRGPGPLDAEGRCGC